ncbi:hypothetical protein OWP15_25590 [Bacillus paranthracis]|uniref:hypothetical protein n=1 Tax=Bacillus cereus group TaxID=86661 RepID=UPI0011232068|nr:MULTISPECIES: hypothetical protein [Bacillus cereus group]MDK7476035.1 hypothetical protein [Bacillus paranthracis]MDX5874483.1 hypothetical protein [Bacillus cereus group sp. BfR-BA-01344]
MNPLARKILHCLSVAGVFMTAFGFLYLLQMYTIGLIFSFNELKINGFPIHIAIYSITSLFLIKKYLTISSPYKDE